MTTALSISFMDLQTAIQPDPDNRAQLITHDPDQLGNLKINQLKSLIKKINEVSKKKIGVSGNKAELVKRVKENLFVGPLPVRANPTLSVAIGQKRVLPPITIGQSQVSKRAKAGLPGNFIQQAENFKEDEPYFDKYQNPFFKEIKKILTFPFGPNYESTSFFKGTGTMNFTGRFDLSMDDFTKIASEEYILHFRLYNSIEKKDYEWLAEYYFTFNQIRPELIRKKTRTAPVKNPFITPHPPIINSRFCKQSNIFGFSCTSAMKGFLVVQLIDVQPTSHIITSVRTKPYNAKSTQVEDELEEVSCKVGIRCPLGFIRIDTPAKGLACTHVQCFDLENYLEFCQHQFIWYCPICNKSLPFHELYIDDYFKTILEATQHEEDEDIKILVNSDGTFEVCAPTPPSSPSPSPSYDQYSPATQPVSQSLSQSLDRTNSVSSTTNSNNPVRKVIDIISLSDDDDDDSPTVVPSLPPIRTLSIDISDGSDDD